MPPTMPSPSPSPLPATSSPAGKEQLVQSLVSEFMSEQRKEQEAERAVLVAKEKKRVPTLVLASLCCLAAWVAPFPRPAFEAEAPPVAYTVASARITLNLAASRVRAFKAQHGRLPETLLSAGITDPAILYQRWAEGQFVLRLVAGETLLTYDSVIAPNILQEDIQAILNQTGR